MRYFTLVFCLMAVFAAQAQKQKKFSPEKFEAEMEAFITNEVKFTEQEAAAYYPLLREMHQKQRSIYGRIRQLSKEAGSDEKACEKAIQERDRLNIELRQIEQLYHGKMIKKVCAAKVYGAIKAESRFHRHMMKDWQKEHKMK